MDAFVTRLPVPSTKKVEAAPAAKIASPFVAVAKAGGGAPSGSKSPPVTGVKRTRVPDEDSEFENLSHSDLVSLVKALHKERESLEARLPSTSSAGKSIAPSASSGSGKKAAAPAAVQPPGPSAGELKAIMKRLSEKMAKAVKKTKQNGKRKPRCEVSEGIPSKATALKLLESCSQYQKSDTAKMTRWIIDDDTAIADWLGIEKLVHPVAFDGKVWCLAGSRPQVYAWAGFASLEVKYVPSANLLTLNMHTYYAGSGSPETRPQLCAYARGERSELPGSMEW